MQPPRKQSTEQVGSNMADSDTRELTYHEQIIEACRALANCTQTLVKSATEAQRELISQGRMIPASRQKLYAADDTQWSQGLISAAKMVAEATQNLCEAADHLMRGTGSEEKVIAAARRVGACTTQLVLACRVKADPNSTTYSGLQNAGQAVKTATEALVATVQRLISSNNRSEIECRIDEEGTTLVTGQAQVSPLTVLFSPNLVSIMVHCG